jgi:ACR3 family arsenite efflux pump ArsB
LDGGYPHRDADYRTGVFQLRPHIRLMRFFKVRHDVATPGALIGASNFFELAVAVAITLFGAKSPAALATVGGVLVEVPVMLSVCRICVSSRDWYQKPSTTAQLAPTST